MSLCSGLTDQVVRRLYRDLEGEFNQRLAGRFPFVAGIPKPTAPDASIAEVRAFFNLYDKTLASEEMFQRKAVELYGAKAPAVQFLNRLAEIRRFFAPWLDSAENKGGSRLSCCPRWREWWQPDHRLASAQRRSRTFAVR